MNPFLRSLLGGQAAGSMIGPEFLDNMERRDASGVLIGNDITVPGASPAGMQQEGALPLASAPTFQSEGPLPMASAMLPNISSPDFNSEAEGGPMRVNLQQGNFRDDFITGNAKAVALNREAEKDTALNSERKGAFGMKGTLRDVIGILGDAFLVQGGGQAIYMPRRQEEKWADAMAGFSDGPEAERIAIERGMRVDPTRTQEFLKQSQLNRTNLGNLDLRGQELGRSEIKDLRTTLTGLAATAVTSDNPEVRAQALRIIQANSANLPADDVLRSGNLELIAGSGATPNQMLTLPLNKRRVEATEANVNIARERLQQGWANVKTNQGRLALAREIFGQNVSEEEFNQQMELMELPFRIAKEVSQTNRNNRSNSDGNSSSNRSERTLTPRSNW